MVHQEASLAGSPVAIASTPTGEGNWSFSLISSTSKALKPDFSLTNTLIPKRSLGNQGGRQPSELLEYSAFGADLPTDKPPPIDTLSRQLVCGETNRPILTRIVSVFTEAVRVYESAELTEGNLRN